MQKIKFIYLTGGFVVVSNTRNYCPLWKNKSHPKPYGGCEIGGCEIGGWVFFERLGQTLFDLAVSFDLLTEIEVDGHQIWHNDEYPKGRRLHDRLALHTYQMPVTWHIAGIPPITIETQGDLEEHLLQLIEAAQYFEWEGRQFDLSAKQQEMLAGFKAILADYNCLDNLPVSYVLSEYHIQRSYHPQPLVAPLGDLDIARIWRGLQ